MGYDHPMAWSLLSTHGLVLAAIARRGPALTLREIGDMVGLTERSVFRIVSDLEEAGHLEAHRLGNRNLYEVRPDAALLHTLLDDLTLGELLGAVFAKGLPGAPVGGAADDERP